MTRYLNAHEVDGDTNLVLVAPKHCNWCGRPLTGRSTRFCSPGGRCWECQVAHKPTSKIKKSQCECGHSVWIVSVCVIRYSNYWYTVPRFKRAIYIRDDFTCQGCGLRPVFDNGDLILPDLSKLAIDHIYPYSKGGSTSLANLQVLCRPCNGRKRDKIDWKENA